MADAEPTEEAKSAPPGPKPGAAAEPKLGAAAEPRLGEVDRLEAALSRIARARPASAGLASTLPATEIASRLDALIADIRGVLDRRASD